MSDPSDALIFYPDTTAHVVISTSADTEYYYDPAESLRVDILASDINVPDNTANYLEKTEWVAVTAGHTYRAQTWWSTAARNWYGTVGVGWYDDMGLLIGEDIVPPMTFVLEREWRFIFGSVVAPTGVAYASLRFHLVTGSPNATDTVWFDHDALNDQLNDLALPITNPGFESGMTGWTFVPDPTTAIADSTAVVDATMGANGSAHALKMTWGPSQIDQRRGMCYVQAGPRFPAEEGHYYHLQGWFRWDSALGGTTVVPGIECFDGNGNRTGLSWINIDPADYPPNVWHFIENDAIVNAGSVEAHLVAVLSLNSDVVLGTTVNGWVDDVAVIDPDHIERWGILRLGDAPDVDATAVLDPDLSFDNVVGSLRVDITHSNIGGRPGGNDPFQNIELTERIAVPQGATNIRFRYRGWVRSEGGFWSGSIGSFYYQADGTYNGNQWVQVPPVTPGEWTFVDAILTAVGTNPWLSLIMVFTPVVPYPAPTDTVWFDGITLADAALAGELPDLPWALFGPGGNIDGWVYGNDNLTTVITGNVSFDDTAQPYPMSQGTIKLAVTGGTGLPASPIYARDTYDTPRYAVTPGNVYFVDCEFRSDSTSIGGMIGASWYDSGNALLSATYDDPSTQAVGNLTRWTLTAPANAATLELRIGATRLTNNSATGNVWFGSMQLYDPTGPALASVPADVLPPDSTENAGVMIRVLPPRWSTNFMVVEGYP